MSTYSPVADLKIFQGEKTTKAASVMIYSDPKKEMQHNEMAEETKTNTMWL